MRIAVCDDNEQELTHFSELITKYQVSRGTSFNCRFFHSGTDLLWDMKGGEYDLVLLDMIMPGVSGIQTAQELRELDKNVRIIFISSSPEFALESYSVGAYHYLLKPVDADSLFPLLYKIEDELSMQKEQEFVLKRREGVVSISFARLEYVEVVNKTVSFHLSDGIVYEVNAPLSDFEKMLLLRPEFIKTHRSYLINLSYIRSVNGQSVVTKNGHSIPVSRQHRNRVQDAYMRFLRQDETAVFNNDAQMAVSFAKAERAKGPWRILIVDDDLAERTYWADILQCHGCMVWFAGSGEEALKLAADETFNCVLLDVMIPGEDGFVICERLRKLTDTPIIFLSCVTESDKQVEGFMAGGTDYITKDTPAELFWAKVETRIKLAASDRTQFCYGQMLLDLSERKVLIDGKELLLTPVEFDILWCLSKQPEHIFTPEEIFNIVWGGQFWDGGQTVQMHMSRLRRKLEKAWEKHCFIETVWGEGYRFNPGSH